MINMYVCKYIFIFQGSFDYIFLVGEIIVDRIEIIFLLLKVVDYVLNLKIIVLLINLVMKNCLYIIFIVCYKQSKIGFNFKDLFEDF